MSIHPEFANQILSGRKRVEFRRRALAQVVTRIVVYATSPICAVVGVAEVVRIQHASPRSLWAAYGHVGGIEHARFDAYFAGTGTGVAYELGRIWVCESPIELGRRGLPTRAPQAYQYVGANTLSTLMNDTRPRRVHARTA